MSTSSTSYGARPHSYRPLASVETLAAAYTILAFVMSASAFYGFFATFGEDGQTEMFRAASSNPFYKMLWLLLYGSAGIALLYSLFREGLQTSIFAALPLVTLVLLSSMWSPNPWTSFFYGGMFTANILIGYSLAQLIPPARFLYILTRVLIACLLITHVLIYAYPDMVATARWGGGWLTGQELNGVFAHKTDAGFYFAILFLLIVCWPGAGLGPLTRIAVGALTLLTVGLTNSATALSAAITFVPFVVFIFGLHFPQRWLAAAAVAVVAFSVIVPFVNLGDAVQFVGRDATLTGRSSTWAAAPEYITARPVLGYGYGGFFDSGEFAPAQDLWRRRESEWFKTPHFHNTALDVTIAIGVTGLVLYLFVVAGAFRILGNRTIDAPTRLACAAVLMMFVLGAAFDFNLMKHNNFPTMFLFYCLFAAQRSYAPMRTALRL